MHAFRTIFCLSQKAQSNNSPERYYEIEGPPASILLPPHLISSEPEASCTLPPLTVLPPELVFTIFDFLPLSSVANIALVSSRCYQLTQPVLKRSLRITHGRYKEILESVSACRFDLSLVRRVTLIQFYFDWNVEALIDVVLAKFANLTDLTLEHGTFVEGEEALNKLCQFLGNRLVSLDLSFRGELLHEFSEVGSSHTTARGIVTDAYLRRE